MEQLFESLASLGLLGILIAIAIQILINSAAMWLAVRQLVPGLEKEPFSRCVMCTVGITVVAVGVSLLAAFLPLPFIGIAALILFYFGSKAVIEGYFEMTEGALWVLVCYLITAWLVWYLLGALFAG